MNGNLYDLLLENKVLFSRNDYLLFRYVIDKSLVNNEFNPESQREELMDIIQDYSVKEIVTINEVSRYIKKLITINQVEYHKMIPYVSGSDDSFYIDFLAWLLTRPEKVLYDFLTNGSESLIKYIEENNISAYDCSTEGMDYAINPYLF